MTNPPQHVTSTVRRPAVLRHWAAWAAIAATALIAFDMSEGADLAPALAASALVYFGAAVLARPSTAWALFFGSVVVIFATELLGGGDVDPTWVVLALALPLLAHGLRPAARRARGGGLPPLQLAALIAFGGSAALALGAGGDVGAYLVAAGLFGHALWDAHHYRTEKVVVRPFAEFCAVLDVLLAAAVVAVTVSG
ncbi:hypothetical protein ACIBBD_36155 [Streptomyces sp. NPDC051315]|uniref:hypothetical protein n=1 Tax=Streptomyces sp. NPDC051315 TaxID=3365650 RepID=UPI0037BDD7F7